MVGNGCTNWNYDTTPAYLEMAYWHGLYDDALYKSMHDNDCFTQFSAPYTGTISAKCF